MGGTHLKRIQGQWTDELGVLIEDDPDEFISRISAIDKETDQLFSTLDGYYRAVNIQYQVFQRSRQSRQATDLIASGRVLAISLSVLFEGLDRLGVTSKSISPLY
jgi:hypothetical protein